MVNNNYIYGILSIFFGQTIIIIYDYFIKLNSNKFNLDIYKNNIIKHISNIEGLFLLTSYLIITWKFELLPKSYYIMDFNIEYNKLLFFSLIQDFLQCIVHYLEHKIFIIRKYHEHHHIYIIPNIYNAFDGSISDTFLMILIPLYTTTNIIHINTITYIIFGSFYSMHLFLIHADYDHIWDKYLPYIGIMNAKCHRIHHQKRIYNYSHIYSFWDRLLGTYKES